MISIHSTEWVQRVFAKKLVASVSARQLKANAKAQRNKKFTYWIYSNIHGIEVLFRMFVWRMKRQYFSAHDVDCRSLLGKYPAKSCGYWFSHTRWCASVAKVTTQSIKISATFTKIIVKQLTLWLTLAVTFLGPKGYFVSAKLPPAALSECVFVEVI